MAKTTKTGLAENQSEEFFNHTKVSSARDIPPKAFAPIRAQWPHLQKGEVPDKGGNVQVGKEPPVHEWHPLVMVLLSQFDGWRFAVLQ